jgi:hypothetical protein
MNTKRELLATSMLAIALAAGIGTLSFGLFSGAPPNVRIDVYAKKNGVTSNSFLPLDQVLLEALVSSNNASIAGAPVTFKAKSPNGTDFLVQTATSDSSGIANVTFQVPWPQILSPETTWELGAWQVQATVQVYGQIQNATTSFNCETIAPTIDIYTNKGGIGTNNPGGNFTVPDENVTIYIEVRDELNKTRAGQTVSFQDSIWGGSIFQQARSATTNASGIATFDNPIRPDIAAKYICIANWKTVFNLTDITVTDSMTFNVGI